MTQPTPQEVAHMADMADWLKAAVQSGFVTGLSITLVDESDGVPVPRHVFFALPHVVAALAGGYVLASHDLAQRMALPPTPAAPSLGAGTAAAVKDVLDRGGKRYDGPAESFTTEDLPNGGPDGPETKH